MQTRYTLLQTPPRSGKTYNFIRLFSLTTLRTQAAAIFFDPKGDDLEVEE